MGKTVAFAALVLPTLFRPPAGSTEGGKVRRQVGAPEPYLAEQPCAASGNPDFSPRQVIQGRRPCTTRRWKSAYPSDGSEW